MKCEDLSCELDSSQRECRNCSSELFRLRAAWDETVEQLDSVRRENKNLADEIKDLLDQLGEGGRSIHELDKQRRRLQVSFILLESLIAVGVRLLIFVLFSSPYALIRHPTLIRFWHFDYILFCMNH